MSSAARNPLAMLKLMSTLIPVTSSANLMIGTCNYEDIDKHRFFRITLSAATTLDQGYGILYTTNYNVHIFLRQVIILLQVTIGVYSQFYVTQVTTVT